MVKNNKENHELFTDKLEEFIRKYEMREGYFRKGRENGCEAFNFYDPATDRIASFRKYDGEFLSFWAMDKDQKIEFLKNNNVI